MQTFSRAFGWLDRRTWESRTYCLRGNHRRDTQAARSRAATLRPLKGSRRILRSQRALRQNEGAGTMPAQAELRKAGGTAKTWRSAGKGTAPSPVPARLRGSPQNLCEDSPALPRSAGPGAQGPRGICRGSGGGTQAREGGIARERRQQEGRRVHEGSLERATQKASRGELPAVIPLPAVSQGNAARRSI